MHGWEVTGSCTKNFRYTVHHTSIHQTLHIWYVVRVSTEVLIAMLKTHLGKNRIFFFKLDLGGGPNKKNSFLQRWVFNIAINTSVVTLTTYQIWSVWCILVWCTVYLKFLVHEPVTSQPCISSLCFCAQKKACEKRSNLVQKSSL